ncbi:MAG: RlmE family RNA methyltransferase [Thermoplasmata archaeon]|nr:RlmE family RNA methyltransferase [Thermoplasmata archaeon]RLF27938.1 MAG: 23S rRNA (uridine(2552)-2'-O)-methyltransferase [Thermoplasmata archaeon]
MAKRWYRDRKKEFYYKQAKKQGYRARSAYKLLQIQQRYNILKRGDTILDLGAAPGGWSQVAKEIVGEEGKVIGVDLLPIKPIKNIHFIEGDITDTETMEKIKELIGKKKIDVVISDMSPNISGNYSLDQARSVWLCEHALNYAENFLKEKGNLVCKVFEGEDFNNLRAKIKKRFHKVENVIPKASRKTSSEVYLVGISFKPDS